MTELKDQRRVVVKVGRREAVAVALAVALVVAAFVVPHLHLGIVTPLIHSTSKQIHDYAGTAPIFGWWKLHVGWGSVPAAGSNTMTDDTGRHYAMTFSIN